MNKKLLFLITLLFVGLLLSACGDNNDSTSNESNDEGENSENEENNEGKKLTVLVEGGSPAEAVAEETRDSFKEETGYDVIIESVPYTGVYDRMRTELTTGSGAFDVATIDTIWLPALYEGLEPIQDIVTDEISADLFPGLIDGATIEDNVYGLPTWTNSKILLYRKDLFEDENNKSAFEAEFGYELAPPGDWEQYKDIASFFGNNEDYPELYGTSVFGASSGDSVASWLDHVTQAGADNLVLDDNGEVIVNDQYHVDALNMLNDLVSTEGSVPENTLETASAETAELFYNGNLAMMLAWGHFYVPANDPDTSDVAGKVGAAPMIAGEEGIGVVPGPWYQVIPSSSNKKDMAKKYLEFMYEKNELYADALGVAARQSVFEEYGKEEKYSHLTPLAKTLNAEQTQNRPSTDQWQEIESEALIPAIQKVLGGELTAQEALDEANEIIEGIVN
ncbi:extracellular solute-binding protein [Gracilibacillus kekensis]|uniref:Carbohydrate ABC transporter substrate-binding protein, CUT1 family n=1 Tax=Gracilibacillus kekensis TaxID=1027249 RepID=A0A1M7LF22_9BACI|nr:extracellular solute-binding protein [Gracilibacillus kekensis]SHM76625.1 carbohydrate ABC transporter substrate-binding protein, CUT1 family [Gracilibacillus kekensis]